MFSTGPEESAAVPGALSWLSWELQSEGYAGSSTRDSAPGQRPGRLSWGERGPRGRRKEASCALGCAFATPRTPHSSPRAEVAPRDCPLPSPERELPRLSRPTMAHLRATMAAPVPPPTVFPPPPLPRDPFPLRVQIIGPHLRALDPL